MVIVFLPNIAGSISKSLPGAIYGVLLILLVYFMPAGIWGALDRLRQFRFRPHPPPGGAGPKP